MSVAKKLFSLVSNTATETPQSVPSTALEGQLRRARKRLQACQKSHETVAKQQAEARVELDRALADEADCNRALFDARALYVETNSEIASRKISKSRELADLAGLRTAIPRRNCEQCDESARASALAVLECEQEIARLEGQLHVEGLKLTATVESFRARTAAKYARLHELRDELLEVCRQIDKEFDSTNAASAELRREGVDCEEATPIAWSHLMYPIIMRAAEQRPETSAYLLSNERLQYRTKPTSFPHFEGGLARAIFVGCIDDASNIVASSPAGDPTTIEALRLEFARRGESRGRVGLDEWLAKASAQNSRG